MHSITFCGMAFSCRNQINFLFFYFLQALLLHRNLIETLMSCQRFLPSASLNTLTLNDNQLQVSDLIIKGKEMISKDDSWQIVLKTSINFIHACLFFQFCRIWPNWPICLIFLVLSSWQLLIILPLNNRKMRDSSLIIDLMW